VERLLRFDIGATSISKSRAKGECAVTLTLWISNTGLGFWWLFGGGRGGAISLVRASPSSFTVMCDIVVLVETFNSTLPVITSKFVNWPSPSRITRTWSIILAGGGYRVWRCTKCSVWKSTECRGDNLFSGDVLFQCFFNVFHWSCLQKHERVYVCACTARRKVQLLVVVSPMRSEKYRMRKSTATMRFTKRSHLDGNELSGNMHYAEKSHLQINSFHWIKML
jgi:hypothetical protein